MAETRLNSLPPRVQPPIRKGCRPGEFSPAEKERGEVNSGIEKKSDTRLRAPYSEGEDFVLHEFRVVAVGVMVNGCQ